MLAKLLYNQDILAVLIQVKDENKHTHMSESSAWLINFSHKNKEAFLSIIKAFLLSLKKVSGVKCLRGSLTCV